MKTIIFISDLHIGRGKKESVNTKRIFDQIAERYPGKPVIIAGDLVDSATIGQFQEIRKLLDKLAKTNPVLMVPGNHDYAWKGNILRPDGWENWNRYLGSPLGWGGEPVLWMGVDCEPKGIDGLGVWKDDTLVYFGIDSGDPEDKEVSARGYISKRLADALAKSLDEYKGKTRIAVLHHHPFATGFFGFLTKLDGSKLLLAALKNNCELLLFGHEHEYGIWWNSRSIPLIVSSHKSTNPMSGDCLMVTIIDIHNPESTGVSFGHRLEVF